MGHTYTKLLTHIVYSTKERRPLILHDWRDSLYRYMTPILTDLHGHLIRAGGIEDHVHLLVRLPPSLAISKAVGVIKANTSKWINDEYYSQNRGFAWQEGYGAFSVSESKAPDVVAYIDHQEEHHKMQSFPDELRELFRRHQIEFDETHLWD